MNNLFKIATAQIAQWLIIATVFAVDGVVLDVPGIGGLVIVAQFVIIGWLLIALPYRWTQTLAIHAAGVFTVVASLALLSNEYMASDPLLIAEWNGLPAATTSPDSGVLTIIIMAALVALAVLVANGERSRS